MKNIYFVIGIPGSGKSSWLNQQNAENEAIFDDISQFKNPLVKLENAIKNNYKNIYICDVNFLEIKTLKNAEEIIKKFLGNQQYCFKYIMFKATIEISKHNVILRDDGRNVEQTIKRFHDCYDVINEYLKNKDLTIFQTEKYKKIKKKP
jgi:hypothetical protein